MKAAVLDGVPNLPSLFVVLVYYIKPVHFSHCVTTPLNGFIKHDKCITPKQKWYRMVTFCVRMLMTHKIIAWTRLASVINFEMCTTLATGCVSASDDGIFYFGDMVLYLSMRALFTKISVKRSGWRPRVIISFGVWFAWQILIPQILAAVIIWFHWFNAEA